MAALELLVHLDREKALQGYIALPVDFEEGLILEVRASDLPEDWAAPEGLAHTQALGNDWVDRAASAMLAVPSRVGPEEPNYLFNPEHPDANHVRIGRPRPFRYASRLLNR